MLNVIGAIFEKESEAYQAMTELRKLPVGEESAILEMAIVKRVGDEFELADSYDSGLSTRDNTLAGGIVGALVGVLGGPIGALLLGSYGMLVGSMIDAGDALGGAALIETVATKMPVDGTAVVILAEEEKESIVDDALGKFEAEVFRFDAKDVALEVREAVNVQTELARQARQKLREANKADAIDKLEENAEILKEGFSK